MIKEVIYKGRDNSIDLQLSSDSGVADFSGVTKIELVTPLGDLATISSIDHPEYFDSTSGDGILKLSLGLVDGLVVRKSHQFDIILYDADNVHGVNWGTFQAIVK